MTTKGSYNLGWRYANAGNVTATRNVYVDGTLLGKLDLRSLPDWNSWATVNINAPLSAGKHTIKIAYDDGNTTPINLDNLTVTQP